MKKTIFLLLTLSGCSLGSTAHTGEHFVMSGTPQGIQAFGDTLIGSMRTAKEKDNAKNQYFAHRADYEKNVTERTKQPGLLQKLFSSEQTGS